ncbi:ABC-2 transporter permease [Peribacillus sp. NPDC097675]|uniref:ABC-2 transporter permease n=1 Tax=Peribacillus sp. NPDC097675 TaxID=3390618 RepID=UPI003D05722D
MFNLIKKDALVQKSLIPLYLAIALVYLFLGTPLSFLIFLLSITLMMNAFYYEEKGNSHVLFNSLPYTRKEIVSSKYVGTLFYTAVIIGVVYISNLIVNGKDVPFSWKDMLFTFGMTMTLTALIFPFFYKFKQQFLLIASFFLIGLFMFTYKIILYVFRDAFANLVQWIAELTDLQLYGSATIIILLLYSGSWLLSIRIYNRKVF